ncbi:hypothetical protein, partial [Polaromonas hydrogenivorans]
MNSQPWYRTTTRWRQTNLVEIDPARYDDAFLEKFSMKKTLIALAALGAMAGVAHAQSTVTLYGVADAYVG